MQFFMRKNKGAISVFLTLILLPMVIFSGMVVDVSRLYAAKTVISGAGDLTMNAALSRYDNKLKNEYGLLAMADTPSEGFRGKGKLPCPDRCVEAADYGIYENQGTGLYYHRYSGKTTEAAPEKYERKTEICEK